MSVRDAISAGTRTESNSSDQKEIKSGVKKHRLKRDRNLLEIKPTEDELKYRKSFEKFNVVNDLYDWIHCTKCQVSFKQDILDGKEIHSHPLLKVLMCETCCEFYGDGEFSLDEDDEDKYCRWCGEGGKLFLCSKCICGFCPKCIKSHFGPKKVSEIKKDDDWVCYLCNPEPLWKLRTICQLAQKESEVNRNQIKKNEAKRTSKHDKNLNQNQESIEQNDKETYKHDSFTTVECDRRTRYSRRMLMAAQTKLEDDDALSSPSFVSSANGEPPYKKRKIGKKYDKDETGLMDGNRQVGFKISSESSSSEPDENVEDSKDTAEREKRETSTNVSRNRNISKLKDILKIAEITSQLCIKRCKKEIRKLDKGDALSNERMVLICENLKSMIILVSSSLSTCHNMILSFQRKFGNRGVDGMFGGGDGTSLLKAISHVLMDKRVKSSYLVSVINDILNRYPYIELGAVLSMDTVISETEVETEKENDIFQNNLGSSRKYESSRETPFTERLRCDSDISTDVFESDSCTVAVNDGQTSNNTGCDVVNPVGNSDEQVRKDNASDFDMDMKKVYENSLKLREQLLKDSSDETSLIDSESSDSSTADKIKSKKSIQRRYGKENGRNQKNLSKEDRELRRLINLRSLEKKKAEDSNSSTSSEESCHYKHQIGRKCGQTNEERSNSDDITLNSIDEDKSSDDVELPNPSSEIDFLKRCTTLLKESILETTSTESDIVKNSTDNKKKLIKTVKRRSKTSYRSKWRDELPDTTTDDSSDEEEKKKVTAKKTCSSTSRDGSSDSFKPLKRKKRRQKTIVSTESDSSCVAEEKLPNPNLESPGKGRRSIRKILKKGSLQLETRQAIKAENERKKKIIERNEIYKKFFPDMTSSDRLVLDFDRDTGEALVEIPKEIVKNLKPHQKEGVKFMWDNCFESLTSLEESSGSGCILAHCMGLGKTLQVITLIATLMKNNLGVDTVLILCPLSVANNWVQEFEYWLEDVDIDIDIYNLVKYKKYSERHHQICQWHKEGGILVLSYDMMRILTRFKAKSKAPVLREHLLDPGPDLVICDEGHIIKNDETSLSKAVSGIKTARRIILTGTPLQNNLLEYHSMVQFIKPNILGTRKEFMNRFANPIRNGQFEDSTAADVKLMRARSHVLHKLLDGCIQRFSYSVLTPFLPEKHEYVISVRLTETQAKLYSYYGDKCKKITINEKGIKLFSDFHWLQKVWTHPKLVRMHMEEHETRNEGEIVVSSSDESVVCIEADSSVKAYWKMVIKPEDEGLSGSGKLLLLFDILKWCQRIGDKVLVFSQSLKNLDLIENFLREVHLANLSSSNREENAPSYVNTWIGGEDYFRMDGSTGADTRSKWCKWFNNKNNKRARLFLISTRAGGLGINLVGANRVVIFDASWNPSHDVQSIFRVYRFGQSKPCYIYRFIAEATMEEKIYERQVTKLSLEKRVLDEHQIERHYTMGNLQELYKYDPLPKEKWPVPIVPKDKILAEILKTRRDVIVTYHEHDTLLENIEEEELTEEERKAAWEDFEKEKFMIEHQLERRAIAMQKDEQAIDELTRDVLRITGMYKASGSQVPYFTPSLVPDSDNSLPFRIVNVQSLDRNFSTGFTRENTNVGKFP